eukprot:SAG31_NODE_3120_length_4655_cov_1.886304_3_plen_158_part_00
MVSLRTLVAAPRPMTLESYDLIIVGAGASGIGCAVMAKEFGVQPGRTLIIERGNAVGSTFEEWPLEMRFITPSFNQQAFGFMDLNSVAFDTSPAQLLHVQHPTGALPRTIQIWDTISPMISHNSGVLVLNLGRCRAPVCEVFVRGRKDPRTACSVQY